MIDAKRTGGSWFIIFLSFVVALVVTVLPLSVWIAPYRPDLVAMVLIFWCLMAPSKVGTGAGWLVGLFMDVLLFGILGKNALSKMVLAFIVTRYSDRIRLFSLFQQSIVVFILLSIDTAILAWVRNILVGTKLEIWAWMPTVVGMILWPILYVILRSMGRVGRTPKHG